MNIYRYFPFSLLQLITFARGKIVMVLEGGYNLKSIANSVFACAKVLLGEEPSLGSVENKPFESTWRVIQAVVCCLSVLFLGLFY